MDRIKNPDGQFELATYGRVPAPRDAERVRYLARFLRSHRGGRMSRDAAMFPGRKRHRVRVRGPLPNAGAAIRSADRTLYCRARYCSVGEPQSDTRLSG